MISDKSLGHLAGFEVLAIDSELLARTLVMSKRVDFRSAFSLSFVHGLTSKDQKDRFRNDLCSSANGEKSVPACVDPKSWHGSSGHIFDLKVIIRNAKFIRGSD